MHSTIDSIRKDILLHFDPLGMIENSEQVKLSESGLYYYSCTQFRQKDTSRNWIVSKIEIWDTEAAKKIFEYITDNDMPHYSSCWIMKDKREYLFIAEAQTGYSVFDVFACQLYSFVSEEDPFIWMDMHISPDSKKLVVEGYYWACPSEIRVYDIDNINELPYKLLYQNTYFTTQNGFKFHKWKNGRSFYLQGGEHNYITVSIPDLEAKIYYLATEEGGRRTPVMTGYRGQFYYDGRDWDARQEFIDKQECCPGESVRIYLHTMSPQYHQGKFFPGKEFEVREGAKVVGKGKITCVLRTDFRK